MQCPLCRTENRGERRFCASCGAALPVPCPACQFVNEPGSRFCGGCGRALADQPSARATPSAPPDISGERRQVTVLFADLVGFTKLASAIDAEELHALMARFFEQVDRSIVGYGGSVDKHIGDAVMGVFGAPVAHDDDPMRAARAALDIHAVATALGAELGRPLAVHIGIASGEVIAAGLGSDRHSAYTVLGDAVNLAARLVERARPEETLISDAVRRAIAPAAECVAAGEIALRGFDAPLRLWRLERLRADAVAPDVPFVGRVAERRQMAGLLETCRETGQGKVVLVRGEAGIGKTRLVTEIASEARGAGFAVHAARVLDFGTATGRDPARLLARSLLGLEPAAGEESRSAAAQAALAAGRVAPEQLSFLLDLLDLPQPVAERALYDAMDNAMRNRGKQQSLSRLILSAAAEHPLLLLVEDIHWADPATLAHLAAMSLAIYSIPAALVLTTRVEGDPLDESWRASVRANPPVTIDLGPLGREDALVLAASFLGAGTRTALACVERADGNPLFLEQLLRHAEANEAAGIPASIRSLVLGRMDRLAPADRHAVQAAAVIGQQFGLPLLRHLIDDPSYDAATLVAQRLIQPEGDGFLFAHALVRDGVYGAVLKARRRELHARAAEWFAGRDPVLHAQHLDRAEGPGAAAAYLAAADHQAAGYHNERALALAERGLEIAIHAGDRLALACRRGDLLLDLGRTRDALAAFEWALNVAETDVQRLHPWIGLAAALRVLDRYDDAMAALDRAERVATIDHAETALARIHYLRGNLYFPLGRYDDCLREQEQALAHARRAHSTENEARALSGLGDAHYAAGRMLTAGSYFEQCVARAAEHGFGRIEVANRSMVGLCKVFGGEVRSALAEARNAVEMAARVGHQRAEMVASDITYMILYEMGDIDSGEPYARRALELSRHLGARRFEAEDLAFNAQILRWRGRQREAMELLEQSLAISREVGMEYMGALILGELAATTDDPVRRDAALAEAEEHLARGSVSHAYLWFYAGAIDVHLDSGDWASAERCADALADYTRAEPLPWSDFHVARARALARWGKGERSDDLLDEVQRLVGQAASYGFGRTALALEGILAAAGGEAIRRAGPTPGPGLHSGHHSA